MKKLLTALVVCLLALSVIGATTLQCYKISWDLKVVKARCWSNEFREERTPAYSTPTNAVYYPTATLELPYPEPEDTPNPYPGVGQ